MIKESNIIEEKKYNIKTDKNNEMELYLRNINNEELLINLYTINQFPTTKYELKCNLNEFQKNRFFKIFFNIEEIIRELDNKIEKSTFIEETDLIIIDIVIGLTVISEIFLEIKKVEKNKDDLYTQNKSLTFMKQFPPKVPEILNLNLNLENISKTNTYGKLNKETLPHVFYNHLMLSNDYNKDLSVKKSYFKASVTKRNKNKILTIVYYTPKL